MKQFSGPNVMEKTKELLADAIEEADAIVDEARG